MLALRFANGIFEPIWNRQFVDHVRDHRRRVDRDRGPRGVLRVRPARSATCSRTTCSSWSPSPPWSRRSTSPPSRCGTRRSRCCARSGRPGANRVVRGQYGPRVRRGQGGPRLPRGARRRRADRPPRRSSPRSCTSTTGAGPARRSTCGSGSGCRSARRRSRSSSSARRTRRSRKAASEGLSPNVLLVHIQPDEGVSLAIGAKVPGPGADPAHGRTWTSSTAAPSAPSCRRPTSG